MTRTDDGRGWRLAAWLIAGALLTLPLVAMQFTNEVDWTASDFVVAAVLLFAPAAAFDYLSRRGGGAFYRLASGVALGTAVLLVWINLAVGVIGGEANPANLMFAGVIAVLVGGMVLARLRPRGMARALAAAAVAQALVGAIAVVAQLDPAGPRVVLGVTGLFVTLWTLSALLFRSARE